ncbi:MAG: phosphoribosylformylglycinamidine synthase subunit PurS [Bifidobacteriaceae bacterium]|jgi:phosphoribosylformylglycinamidine synthase|nr:phosphoribosylformylglycinamidine synthase subunit PurS [Bifidobacteriaceae bacterium]MCI1978399.1 phosphoribosylformylglycinamidine synthase subunit PurS [Bifidobacteriaceae bacterium]
MPTSSKNYKVTVYVTYKESVLDPQGQAVQGAITRMGYEGIDTVRIGKYFEITAHEVPGTPIEQTVDSICDKLLANPNMETYRYDIEEDAR